MNTRTRELVAQHARLGAPSLSPAPGETLLVHILFLDLVGYSRLTNEQQEQASEELICSVRRTQAYQRAMGGDRLTCLDTGDGMALVFEGEPLGPALCALELAQIRGESPNHGLRMGMHSGPVMRMLDINDRANFKGVGINVAQRVMDCAISGQITLTEHYASILSAYDGWSKLIVDRGAHRAKHGLKLRICELKHEYSPKLLSAESLRREMRANPLMKWVKVAVLLAGWASSTWLAASYQQDSLEESGWNAGVSGQPVN